MDFYNLCAGKCQSSTFRQVITQWLLCKQILIRCYFTQYSTCISSEDRIEVTVEEGFGVLNIHSTAVDVS
jgi:hypothetical protein